MLHGHNHHANVHSVYCIFNVFQESKPDTNQWLPTVSPGKSKAINDIDIDEDSENDVLLTYDSERDQVSL
jgi:hypothetical protein